MERNKVVPIGSRRFQLRRLPPEVGSFIFMRMMGLSMRAAQQRAEETASKPPSEEAPKPAKEMTKEESEFQVRALVFSLVSSGAMSFEDFKFVQLSCLRVVSVIEVRAETDFPMPIYVEERWTTQGEELSSDPGLVMRLVSEVLIFCFADFFAGAGLGM